MIVDIHPIALQIGSFTLYWYSVLFAVALIIIFLLMEWFFKRENLGEQFNCFLPFGFIGAIAGARLGHFLFYAPDQLISNPMIIFQFGQEKDWPVWCIFGADASVLFVS